MLVGKILDLEKRHPHPDAEPLGLVRPRDHTSVIVGKHHDRPAFQGRLENPLAGNVKIITINKCEYIFHNACITLVTTPQTSNSIFSSISWLR